MKRASLLVLNITLFSGQCKESFCPEGQMTGNPGRAPLTSLACNGLSQWVDAQNAVYTSAQCEIRELFLRFFFFCVDIIRRPLSMLLSAVQCCSYSFLLRRFSVRDQYSFPRITRYLLFNYCSACDQCMPLPPCGTTCPTGFICTPVEDQPGSFLRDLLRDSSKFRGSF